MSAMPHVRHFGEQDIRRIDRCPYAGLYGGKADIFAIFTSDQAEVSAESDCASDSKAAHGFYCKSCEAGSETRRKLAFVRVSGLPNATSMSM